MTPAEFDKATATKVMGWNLCESFWQDANGKQAFMDYAWHWNPHDNAGMVDQ